MAAFMIFVDAAMAADANTLVAEKGLQAIEAGASRLTWAMSMNGPGGVQGMIGFWIDPEMLKSNSYQPDKQKWVSIGEGTWLGTYLDDPVKPSDLLKTKPYEKSLPCLLEDGNTWMIPVARWLPHVWGQDTAGVFSRLPADHFTDFCKQAEEVFQYFVGSDGKDLEIQCQWGFVCQALSLNYRLCPSIISALKLIGDISGGRILAATVEMTLTRDVEDQKKS